MKTITTKQGDKTTTLVKKTAEQRRREEKQARLSRVANLEYERFCFLKEYVLSPAVSFSRSSAGKVKEAVAALKEVERISKFKGRLYS